MPSTQDKPPAITDDVVAKLKLDLYETIEAKMNASLERDRQFIQSTIGAASKIGGYVLSIVALAITLFGIKTCSDVKSSIDTNTKSEIDKLIKDANPVAAYERDTRRYMEGAMVNYYRIQLAAPKEDFESSLLPPPSDVERMRQLLRDPETDDNLFSQVIDILVSLSGRNNNQLGADLTEMYVARPPSLSWVQKSVAKRAAIIDALGRLNYGDARSAILPTIDSEDAETRLRVAAIKYAVRVNATNAIPHLVKISNDNERTIKQTALQGIVALDPDNDTIKDYIHKIATDPAETAEGLRDAFETFSLLSDRVNRPFLNEDEKKKIAQTASLIAQVLDACADHNTLAWLSFDSFSSSSDRKVRLSTADVEAKGTTYVSYSPALQWFNAAGVNEYLESAMSQPNISNIARKFLVLTYSNRDARYSDPRFQLIADLGQNTAVAVEGNRTVVRDDAPYGVVFSATAVGPSLSMAWNDTSGIKRIAHVLNINHPEDVTFRWRRPTDSDLAQ
jgi:hypothetical protein